MSETSENVILLVFGAIISLVLAFSSKYVESFNFNTFKGIYTTLVLALIFILIIIFAIQSKTNEIKESIITMKYEQKKFDEKLKIYNRLAKIEERLKI